MGRAEPRLEEAAVSERKSARRHARAPHPHRSAPLSPAPTAPAPRTSPSGDAPKVSRATSARGGVSHPVRARICLRTSSPDPWPGGHKDAVGSGARRSGGARASEAHRTGTLRLCGWARRRRGGSRGSPRAPRRSQPRAPYLAGLVELLLQPRHRHRASRRRPSRRDPANRRDNASDRHPGAADPPRASAGSAGAASTALSPAPRPPLRPPQPVARPRGQDITWQPHASGPACVRAPPAGVRALTHVACGASGRFCQRVGPGAPRAAAAPAASPGVREVALMSSEM